MCVNDSANVWLAIDVVLDELHRPQSKPLAKDVERHGHQADGCHHTRPHPVRPEVAEAVGDGDERVRHAKGDQTSANAYQRESRSRARSVTIQQESLSGNGCSQESQVLRAL